MTDIGLHKRKPDRRGGFTLIELLVVMSILAILATIAVPMYLGQRTKAARAEAMTNLEALRLLQEQYYAENGEYAASAGTCAKDNDNIAAIQAELPGFKPGNQLFFSYCIEQNIKYDGSAETPCFRASAFGNTGTPVNGHTLRVDCNNDKDY